MKVILYNISRMMLYSLFLLLWRYSTEPFFYSFFPQDLKEEIF